MTDQPAPSAATEATDVERIEEMDADRIAEIKDWVTDGTAPSCVTEMLTHIDALIAERDALRAELTASQGLVERLHALVCNAFGYDKSIVRTMAIWMRGQVNNQYRELGQRVMDAEEAARVAAPCSLVHPLAAPGRADSEGEDHE